MTGGNKTEHCGRLSKIHGRPMPHAYTSSISVNGGPVDPLCSWCLTSKNGTTVTGTWFRKRNRTVA